MRFNIHTHKNQDLHNEIYNHRIGVDFENQEYSSYFSVGIHPWDLEIINIEIAFKELEHRLIYGNCLAMGECGFDKVCGTDLDLQKQVFRKQLKLAHQSNKKVLIIHCVKAYQEIIEEKKNCKYEFTWILHAFNGSKQLAEQMSSLGFYFSLGSALLDKQSKIYHSIKTIPLNRMFFETDESKQNIDVIYKEAANILNLKGDVLENQIMDNFNNIFILKL